MFGMGVDIGIDLGTANVLVYVKHKGIVLNEPAVVAVNRDTNRILAIGTKAAEMMGRMPGDIVAIRPLREGVIADYDMTENMLRYFIQKVIGHSFFFRPRILICIPSGVTMVERRAVQEAAEQAGARRTEMIEEPMAAAIGANLPVEDAMGSMVVDIGGGTTDIAVISLGGIVLSDSLPVAGDKFDEAIIAYVRKEFNLMIGEPTAAEVKIKIGAAYQDARAEEMEIRGRYLPTGQPKALKITSSEVSEALKLPVERIITGIKKILEETPPELAADIMDRGIMLTGGSSLLYGFAELLRRNTNVPIHIADDPLLCVALGTGKSLEYGEVFASRS